MNDASFLRAPTIMKAFHDAGAKVAVVTAKDKLRALLGKGLDMSTGRAIAFSSEKADKATAAASTASAMCWRASACRCPRSTRADLSEFVFAAGVSILKSERPGPDVSLDHRLRAAQGRARLRHGERVLRHDGPLCRRARRGGLRAGAHRRSRHERQASAERRARRHLSAGRCSTTGWARASRASSCRSPIPMWCITARSARSRRSICRTAPTCRDLLTRLRAVEGIELAISRGRGLRRFELPADRIGDIVVISTDATRCSAPAREKHDLSGLTEPLRSHGGLTEQVVPMIANRTRRRRRRGTAAQFRRLRRRAEPRRVERP